MLRVDGEDLAGLAVLHIEAHRPGQSGEDAIDFILRDTFHENMPPVLFPKASYRMNDASTARITVPGYNGKVRELHHRLDVAGMGQSHLSDHVHAGIGK